MAALPIPTLMYSHAVHCRKISSHLHQLQRFSGKKRQHQDAVRHKHICKGTESQDARLDGLIVLEPSDEIGSKAEAPHTAIFKFGFMVNKIEDCVEYIKSLLSTMGDGRISVSPYDTAWVALIKDINGRDIPQFPSCLEWIVQHQLPDGSWGDGRFFCVYDRLVNTLACVVALRSWNVHANMWQKGIKFFRENVYLLQNAKIEHMPAGFEVVIPTLLQRAQNLGISNIPVEAPSIKEIYIARDRKMKRIPKDVMHKVPTSLLYSLEAFDGLDWGKLLKLQSADGSFLTSVSSTAFAFMETNDSKCLKYIHDVVQKFGGAPHCYPVDIFARLWAVDRLQRLGISHFFEPEIEQCISYVGRYWDNKGFFSGRDSEFCDIDDTSMAFRLLRLNGYVVDPNVFRNFKSGDKFSCFGGQMIESATPIFNLYRASQIQFPGEDILDEANEFSYKFLSEKLANHDEFLDKNGLEIPWWASLPRVEARCYLEHYGGANDVWIGKTLYRMEEISNDVYLKLAKLDFKKCQAQHQVEWTYMQEWYENCSAQEFGMSGKDLLHAYFLATASIFEPERSKERLAWTKSQIICRMIASFLNKETTTMVEKHSLLSDLRNNINGLSKRQSSEGEQHLVNVLLATLLQFWQGFDKYTRNRLRNAWIERLTEILQQGDSHCWGDADMLVTTLNICGHNTFNEGTSSRHEYKTLSKITNKICYQLSQIQIQKAVGKGDRKATKYREVIQQDLQELLKLVLEESAGGIDRNIKQTFLTVTRTFYYSAFFADEIIHAHTLKVLFEPVV